MRIAIPSYKRQSLIIKKTIPLLLNNGFTFDDIDIFVANEEEKTNYQNAMPDANIIQTDILQLHLRLNYILNEHYDEGTEVVLIEDDIRDICRGKDSIDVQSFFKDAFDILKKENLYIFGISPTDSFMYHKEGYSKDFRFILGVLYGIRVRKDASLNVNNTYKQDYERTILYYMKDAGLIRFNDVYCKTTYKTIVGGLGGVKNTNRIGNEILCVKYMLDKYPEYCYQHKTKENEIKLKRLS